MPNQQQLYHIPEHELVYRLGELLDGGWRTQINQEVKVSGELSFVGPKRIVTAPSFLAGSVLTGASLITQLPLPVEFTVEANCYALRDAFADKVLEVISESPLFEGESILEGMLRRRRADGALFIRDPIQTAPTEKGCFMPRGAQLVTSEGFFFSNEHSLVEEMLGYPVRDIAHSVELQSTILAILEHELLQQLPPPNVCEGFEKMSGPIQAFRDWVVKRVYGEETKPPFVSVSKLLSYFNPEAKGVVLEGVDVLVVKGLAEWVYADEDPVVGPSLVGMRLFEGT
ncbi:MAG: hypothetical protein KDD64_00610 [Bdellovibrionales bacterium]|nr:hypothetical protein [Bdellovibrionales bacterium]